MHEITMIVNMAVNAIAVVFFITLTSSLQRVWSSEDADDELTIFDDIRRTFNQTHTHKLGVTFPGTKWCGPGDNAESNEDLGTLRDVDMCCRGHDNCDDIIFAGETQHGLTNPDLVTRLHCKCEKEFQNCLRKVNSYLSSAIGTTYTTARQYCYKLDYPIKKCIEYQEGFIQRRCIRYKLNKRKPKEWQWFDIPFY